ncbi:MAG TPA: chemotaxis protein CheB [Cyanobacteria bacterium UBA8803]|nr:chemotaxis protein CheB [Cyanobacteria bacterium UBA9273]HBL57996.1 chemotaxis protein CheB [Cyanobacteria bacterium UBA8803]
MSLLDHCPYELVVIGTSLGGLHALEVLLAGLPESFLVPMAIAQHRHKNSEENLSGFLQRQCALPLTEVEDKDAIAPGRIYLAPADYHLLVEAPQLKENSPGQNGSPFCTFALSTDAPINFARPSIDVLFESAADTYAEKAVGVILTGASADGSQGLAKIKAHGGLAIVQEPTTAFCPMMPKAAISAVATAKILPLDKIAPFLVNICCPALR